MAAWYAVVWVALAVVMSPVSSFVLGWSWLRGSDEVVANEALLGWMFTPQGLAWLVLAGSLGIVGTVLHFAGIFEIVTEDLVGAEVSIPAIVRRLARDIPALIRLCATVVLAACVAATPLIAVLLGIRSLWLDAHDINYYLAEQPAEWWYAVAAAAACGLVWLAVVAWVAGRSILALPAYLDGHRPVAAAVRRSWRNTRAEGARIVRLIMTLLVAWVLGRSMLDAAAAETGQALMRSVTSVSSSLDVLVAVTGAWTLLSLGLHVAAGFLGIAFVSTLLTKLYYEDTPLHHEVEPPGIEDLSDRIEQLIVRWARPARALPLLGCALVVSTAAGALLLERVGQPGTVLVAAHRAGPAPAPENTLAALERAIEAGADWAEIDVQLTRDGVPVVLHDVDLMRVAGDRRRIATLDYRELSGVTQRPDDGTPAAERRIATLVEFLRRAEGRIGLMIELKYYGWDPRLAEETARVIRETEGRGPVMLMSLELRAVRQLRELGVDVPVGYVAAAAVGNPTRLPVDFLAVSRPSATASLLGSAGDRDIAVHVWTVNRVSHMADVIQAGASGIITDEPELAVQVRRELSELSAVSRLLLRAGLLLAVEDEPESDP